jgi:hypothetical protein
VAEHAPLQWPYRYQNSGTGFGKEIGFSPIVLPRESWHSAILAQLIVPLVVLGVQRNEAIPFNNPVKFDRYKHVYGTVLKVDGVQQPLFCR